MGTRVDQSNAEPELAKQAAAYRMHGERVDGNDVLAVREAASRLLAQARDERRPSLFETVTYRYRGHSVADAGKVYRTPEEVQSWRERDPITRYGLLLGERGIATGADLEAVWEDVAAEVKEAIAAGPGRARSRAATASTSTSTATRRGTSSSARMATGRRSASAAGSPNGRRDLQGGAAAGARRGARARPRRLPHGRGDRQVRGLVQGHRRPVGEVRRRAACARRRSRRRASSAPGSARP